jgi:hypothetical protein
MTDDHDMVGRVLRASTRGMACGTHSNRLDDKHDFGAFVKAPIANNSDVYAIGLIYAVEIKDDMLINELVMADSVNPNVLRDQRENRMIPVEISVLNVGYGRGKDFVHSVPPRPPLSLSKVTLCSREDVLFFTSRLDFFRLVVNASEVPSDDLIAAMIRYARYAYPEGEQHRFLVATGQHLGRLLSGDSRRLAAVLSLIKP